MSNAITNIHNLIYTHKFIVTLGNLLCGFSSITNIEDSMEYDSIQEGGVNDRVLTWRKPTSQQHRLIFEKGTGRSNIWYYKDSVLHLGHTFAEGGSILLIQRSEDTDMGSLTGAATGDLRKQGIRIVRKYSFDNPMVVRWEATNLGGSDAQIMIDRMEVVHDGLYLDNT